MFDNTYNIIFNDILEILKSEFALEGVYSWNVSASDRVNIVLSDNGPYHILFDASAILKPTKYLLHPNYPNPFSDFTMIYFELPEQSEIKLKIYDIHGRELICLFDGVKKTGHHIIQWDGKDRVGNSLGTGIYLYQVETNEDVLLGKMILLK